MPYIPIVKVQQSVLDVLAINTPIMNTFIDAYYTGRRMNYFLGRRLTIATSSLPATEVYSVSDSPTWIFCRVQNAAPTLGIDITVDNKDPQAAEVLLGILVTVAVTILNSPNYALRRIPGTDHNFWDSHVTNVTYGTAQQGGQKVANLTWTGQFLSFPGIFGEPDITEHPLSYLYNQPSPGSF